MALIIAFLSWIVTLVTGRAPRGFHDFLGGYVRYALHVESYVFLAANPYPAFFAGTATSYPVDLEIDPPARQNRWITGFRLILFLPAVLILTALLGGFGGGGRGGWLSFGPAGIAGTAAFLVWFAALARGRAPRGLRDLIGWALGYSAQASAYLFLLTDRYPQSAPEAYVAPIGTDPRVVRLVVTDDLRRSRLTVFFRLLLAFPHLVWYLLWSVLALPAAVVNWVATLARGRSPTPLTRFLAAYVRYTAHLTSFVFLIGNPFPGFVGKAASYPIDLELDPFGSQRRLVTLFRLILAIPAILVASAASSLTAVVGLLGWFASLATGRMPKGLRNAGAYGIGYSGQLGAYLFVLGDRYPYAGPVVEVEPAE